MITENIKKGTGLGHDAALRVELADQIRSRVEYRPIECLIEYDLNRGEKIYYRPDTQEQIDRVSMSKDELRIALANQNQANLKHGQKDLF